MKPQGSSCPCCGADLLPGDQWPMAELLHSRQVLDLIDEVEAARRGIAITHVVDPLPDLKRRMGTRESLDNAERAIKRTQYVKV